LRSITGGETGKDEKLWRYLSVERFLSLIDDGRLYFASANEFADSFEGAVSVDADGQSTRDHGAASWSDNAFRELKRLTKISCWHRADFESDAMWKLYAAEHKGVAICTTTEHLLAAFKPFRLKPQYGAEELWYGPVNYIDLTAGRIKRTGMLDRFFIKHRAFEWEREFRLAISLRGAEEFGVPVPDLGIFVQVDVGVLADRILIGSTITAAEQALVKERVMRAGLGDRLEVSSLLGTPRYH